MRIPRSTLFGIIFTIGLCPESSAQAKNTPPQGTEAALLRPVDYQTSEDKMLALAQQLERPIPRTAEEKTAQERQFKEDLVDACGKPLRSSRYVCAIALYILYDDVSGRPLSTMTRPIAQIVLTNEFRPGNAIGNGSMLPPPRSEYLKARYVEAPVLGEFSKRVSFESLFFNQNGRDMKTGATGWYYLAAIIGRNDRRKYDIPEAVFERQTYARATN